jgi:hypothetical protein
LDEWLETNKKTHPTQTFRPVVDLDQKTRIDIAGHEKKKPFTRARGAAAPAAQGCSAGVVTVGRGEPDLRSCRKDSV